MPDKEIVDALKNLNITLSRLDKGNFYNFMLQQRMAERSTPTNSKFGTAVIASASISWVQILQRNERRKNVNLIVGSSATGYLMVNNDNLTDANESAQMLARSIGNSLDIVLADTVIINLARTNSNNPITIDTTGPIYVAGFSITSSVASHNQTVVSWEEAIYSDVDAIPGFMKDTEHHHKPGDIHKLTAGTMPWLDHDALPYERGGVR